MNVWPILTAEPGAGRTGANVYHFRRRVPIMFQSGAVCQQRIKGHYVLHCHHHTPFILLIKNKRGAVRTLSQQCTQLRHTSYRQGVLAV